MRPVAAPEPGVELATTPESDLPAIQVTNLAKHYGSIRAVDGLSFSVERGEIFGLLGPNGAGKTTTVETLEGYRKPDSGTVRVIMVMAAWGLGAMLIAVRRFRWE